MKERSHKMLLATLPRYFFCATVIILTLFQSNAALGECEETDSLEREAGLEHRIAVQQGEKWLICKSSKKTYEISAQGMQKLTLYWAIPACKECDEKQVVYVSSLYKPNQPLSIYRNAIVEGPALFQAFRLFQEVKGGFRKSAHPDFLKFHQAEECQSPSEHCRAELNRELWEKLKLWHLTNIWGVIQETEQSRTYQLVSATLADEEGRAGLAKRLIHAEARRPFTSWIPFESRVEKGEELKIVAAYSKENPANAWVYQFRISDKPANPAE